MKFVFEVIQEQEFDYYIKWDSNIGAATTGVNKLKIPMPDISMSNKIEFDIEGDPVNDPFGFKVIGVSKIVKTIEKTLEPVKQIIVEKKIPYNIMAKPQIEL